MMGKKNVSPLLQKEKGTWKQYISYAMVAAVLLTFLVQMLANPRSVKMTTLFTLERISIAMILAVSLSMVVGFLGELSLGHAGFMCVGGYMGGKLATILVPELGNNLLTLVICLLAGGLSAAICGIIVGLPALRLRGDYLAIVTLAFGEIVKSVFMNSSDESFGGALGLPTPRYEKKELFIYAFIMVLITLFVVQNIIHSRHGRAVTAIRDNEIAARATGISVTRYKLIVFAMSAFFAGIAGVLYSFSNQTLQSSKFGFNYSIEILVMVVLGGMGSINGALISSTLITLLNVQLPIILKDKAVYQNVIYALILILIVIYKNAPKLSGVREKLSIANIKNKNKPKGSV